MKKLLIITITLLSLTAKAQDKRFTMFTYSDPVATYKDGFNAGFGIDYQMSVTYFKAQLFVFPDLNGKTYTEITGTPLGFNLHDMFENWRVYGGLKLGVIIRDGGPFPTYGFEAGVDYYFNGSSDGVFVGVGVSRDRRTDVKVWDESIEPYWRNNGFVKFGFTF